jgi:hypothetical protein
MKEEAGTGSQESVGRRIAPRPLDRDRDRTRFGLLGVLRISSNANTHESADFLGFVNAE